MDKPKTIKLLVTIPDPGEWCCRVSAPYGEDLCDLWSEEFGCCSVHHQGEADPNGEGYRRPPSCKDSEVKE